MKSALNGVFWILISAGVAAQAKVACESQIKSLNLAHPAKSDLRKPVQVKFKVEDDFLIAEFKVKTATLYTKDPFGPGEYPYNFDVVEIFVTVNEANYPYFEFEITPLGQTYQVEIQATGKFVGGVDLGMMSRAQIKGTEWTAEIKIPLEKINGLGDPLKLKGNAFGIFGKKSQRTYWSLNLPPQKKPNFHLPKYFRSFWTANECHDN